MELLNKRQKVKQPPFSKMEPIKAYINIKPGDDE